jgi:NADP-dependent 3-hydroxy acid dehydrogenase YdfG
MLLAPGRDGRQQHEEKDMTALRDKVAIVTEASSGIGYATARLFAQEGASVVVSARRHAALDALVAEIEADGGHAVSARGIRCRR